MKLRLALAAATALVLPLAAHAQPITGPYVSLEGGTSILNPTDFNVLGGSGKLQYRPSYAGDVAVGYGIGDGFRIQIDGNYFHNTAHRVDGDGGGSASIVGHENRYGGFVNVLYDIPVGLPVFPYVGAGAGYQYASAKYSSGEGLGNQVAFGGDKGSFAYDVIAGVSYPLDMVLPGLRLTAEYRFTMDTESYKYGFSVLGGFGAGVTNPSIKIGQQSSHTFMAGLTYALFPPAPPAPPAAPAPAPVAAAPAPAPARTYLVFFDWDKSVLTPRAVTIIGQAASDSKSGGTTTLSVSGYTDTSGTPDYNMGLSERRAQAVAGQLVSDGVPQSEIEIHAYGETHLLVPTGPGVREPQNRRVEIVLQ